MSIFEQELNCQSEALKELSHNDNDLATRYVLWNNMVIAKIFRDVINDYEKKFNRVPTCNELIYHTSEVLSINIRNIAV